MSHGPQTTDPARSSLFGYISVIAVLLAAFLLFLIQPLVAKAIVPWFGGAASTWSVVMLYFQGLLLLGYFTSYILQHMRPRDQSIAYILICGLAILFSYAQPYLHTEWISNDYPLVGIIVTLVRYITVPGLLLATVSTMIQVWYSSVYKREPYILYSISNIGSLASLILYPFLIEPHFTLAQTFLAWQVLIVACALCCITLAVLNLLPGTRAEEAQTTQNTYSPTPWRTKPGRIAMWLYLPACSCAFLVSMTHYLCRDIAPIPLLWILPLALYLVTYIVAFGPGKYITDIVWVYLSLIAIASFLYISSIGSHSTGWFLASGLFLLYAACQFCHSYMVSLRPGPDRLTTFYLCMAVGGFIGSALVNLVLPFVFTDHSDIWLCLILVLLALTYRIYRTAAYKGYQEPSDTIRYRCLQMALFSTAVICGYLIYLLESAPGIKERNFYGIIKVKEQITTIPGAPGAEPIKIASLILQDGNTVHGMQFKEDSKKGWATTYYGTTSGVGVLLKDLRQARNGGALSVGVIGLGGGTLSTYGKEGDTFTFYEINPAVVRVAQRDFSFLRNCKAKCDIVVGDARLSLAADTSTQFDLLVVDAFSSDSVPAHLLTKEVFEIYLKHIKQDGYLAFHISNRYLDLAPVVTGSAMQSRLQGVVALGDGIDAALVTASEYVILSRNPVQLSKNDKLHTKPLPESEAVLWTDDYSNLFRILKQ